MLNQYERLTRYELAALPYHLTEAERWDTVVGLCSDIGYIFAIFDAGVYDDAIQKYSRTLEKTRPHVSEEKANAIQALLDFIRSEYDYLAQFPQDILQVANNYPDESPVHHAAESVLGGLSAKPPQFTWINKSAAVGPLLLRLKHSSNTSGLEASRSFTDWIRTCCWRIDGCLVSVGEDHQLKTWDADTGKMLSSCRTSPASPIGFSRDGRFLLASDSRRVSIIDSLTGRATDQLIEIDFRISSHAWSDEGQKIAFGGESGQVVTWEPQRRGINRIGAGSGEVRCCAWSPDAKYLVWGVGPNPLIVWDCENSREHAKLGDARMVVEGNVHTWTTFKGHKGGANACAWSPDGRYIASGSGHGFGVHDDDFSIRIWDTSSFTEVAALQGHRDRVTSVSWSHHSQRLASTSGSVMRPGVDNSIRVWDANSFEELAVLAGHTNEVVSCVWHADGFRLVSASKDGTLIVWDSRRRPLGHKPISRCYVSNSGTMVALARKDNVLQIVNAETGRDIQTLSGHEDEIISCEWSPDDVRIATGSLDRSARVWNITNSGKVAVLRGHHGNETYTAGGQRVVWGRVDDLAWSPDGQLLATAGSDRVLIIWSREGFKKYRTLLGHLGPVARCGWSLDGSLVSYGGSFEHVVDNSILIWDVTRGFELGNLSPYDPLLQGITCAHRYGHSEKIISLDHAGVVEIKESDWHQQKEIRITHANALSIWEPNLGTNVDHIIWLPNSRHILLSSDNFIRLLDAMVQQEILRFRAAAKITQLCLAVGGRRVFALDESGALYILGIEGVELGTLVIQLYRRLSAVRQTSEKAYWGRCPSCGKLVSSDLPALFTHCENCRCSLIPTVYEQQTRFRHTLAPMDETNGEAWLRVIRGLLINKTATDDELRALYRRLSELEPDGETFNFAIHDEYNTDINGLNSALWSIGASLLLAIDQKLAKKCLRTALLFTPDDDNLKDGLASLNAENLGNSG